MKLNQLLALAAFAMLILPASAQDASNPTPASSPAVNNATLPATKLTVNQINADLTSARAAIKDQRFADADALMLQATASKPDLLYPWVVLGQAQLRLKQYHRAEASFKTVLGLDPASSALSSGFFDTNRFGASAAPSVTGNSDSGKSERTPEVQGIAWSSLGEIYVHANKVADAQSAFDRATRIDAKNASLYRNNEVILFFQAGNGVAQVGAADKAIALDPSFGRLYYFKAQGLLSEATVDSKTQKVILPPGCAEAYRKYLEMRPSGQFASDARTILAATQPPR
jgi:tetratricopeptide (TPR) repeat protein